jgi:outer membrane protein OmpA-like peptidoglycan-associated protein
VQDGKTVDTIETSQSQALFEKKSSYLNTTLSCMIQVGQESLVSNVSSLNSKLMTEASEIKRAELKRLDAKYYADRTAAYAKRDREFARIAEIKKLEISATKTSSAILLASSKYRKAFTAASDLWKAELKKATTDRDAAQEVAQTNYLDFLEKSGVSIYPRAVAPVVTPTPTINPQPTVQKKKVGTVYMATGSYQLSAETKKQLTAIAKTINASSAKNILVHGHTDIRRGVNNTVLSKNRAKAVAAYLRPLLKVKKISIGWFASRKPLNTGNSPAAYSQNRRVEVWVK